MATVGLPTWANFKLFVAVNHRSVPVIMVVQNCIVPLRISVSSNVLSSVAYLVCAHAVASTPLDNDAAGVLWLQRARRAAHVAKFQGICCG